MIEEQWDIYNKCFEKTGRFITRGDNLAEGEYHLVVHIYPINKKGQIFVQKRSDNVQWMPGVWAVTGGSAIAGETPWEACHREFLEEIGIDIKEQDSMLAVMFKRRDSFNAVFIVNIDFDLSEVSLQKEEVAEVDWMYPEEIRGMMRSGDFHRYNYFEWLIEMYLE